MRPRFEVCPVAVLQDPKVQEAIRKGQEEYLAGKTRPAEELAKELDAVARRVRKRGAPR